MKKVKKKLSSANPLVLLFKKVHKFITSFYGILNTLMDPLSAGLLFYLSFWLAFEGEVPSSWRLQKVGKVNAGQFGELPRWNALRNVQVQLTRQNRNDV